MGRKFNVIADQQRRLDPTQIKGCIGIPRRKQTFFARAKQLNLAVMRNLDPFSAKGHGRVIARRPVTFGITHDQAAPSSHSHSRQTRVPFAATFLRQIGQDVLVVAGQVQFGCHKHLGPHGPCSAHGLAKRRKGHLNVSFG